MARKRSLGISRKTIKSYIKFLRGPKPKKVLLTRSAEEMRKMQKLRETPLDQLIAKTTRKGKKRRS